MQQQSTTGAYGTDPGGAGPSANGSAGTSASDLLDQAKQTASQTQQLAGDFAGQVKQAASNRLSGQIDQAAQGISGASQALRSVGEQLQQEQPQLATYAERAAEQVENVSSYLKGKDLDQLVHDVESFARRKPAAFLGSAFVLGIAAARFLRSSSGSGQSDSAQIDRSAQMDRRTQISLSQRHGPDAWPAMSSPIANELYPTPGSMVNASASAPASSSPVSPAVPGASTSESGQPSAEPWRNAGTAA